MYIHVSNEKGFVEILASSVRVLTQLYFKVEFIKNVLEAKRSILHDLLNIHIFVPYSKCQIKVLTLIYIYI